MRSRTGCLTCRNRKLKCDERKPICGQCEKASRECVPSPGVVFRHQQNASMNGGGDDNSRNGLKRFYGYKETFDKDSVWVKVPQELTFVHVTDPYNEPAPRQLSDAEIIEAQRIDSLKAAGTYPTSFLQSHGLEALSAAASGDHYFQPSSRQLEIHIDPRLDSSFAEASPIVASTALLQQIPTENEFDSTVDDDIPFLLRYYSEGPADWMDIFDLGSFFSVDIPVKAASCPLLLYAAIALSAKALGRIRITPTHPKSSGSKRTPSQWLHKARFYYDQAIILLRRALENETRPLPGTTQEALPVQSVSLSTPFSVYPVGEDSSVAMSQDASALERKDDLGGHAPGSAGMNQQPASRDVQGLPKTDSDELVATTAILCVFEFLDASGVEWSRHLDGARSLFDIARDGTMPLSIKSPSSSADFTLQPSTSTKGRRAVFWNICRQEMLNAFINNTGTRLDTTDLSLWRSAGLHISQAGYVIPSNDPALHEPMPDDMIANALIWLTMKLVNFISAGDEFPHELGLGIRQTQLLEYWEGLERQLDVWFEGLPHSFKPSATEWSDKSKADAKNVIKVPKKWFARPMCASTMQSFHFARIQLLLNKPHVSTGASHTGSPGGVIPGTPWSLAQRHASYASILRQSRKHAEEIVSIGLGLTNDGARIHSVQPLYTAGQVLGMRESGAKPIQSDEGGVPDEVEAMRSCILNLLQNIQRETGWATEYRMQQLLEQWGLPNGSG